MAHWSGGGSLFHEVQPIGRGANSELFQRNPNFPVEVTGDINMNANVIHQGQMKPSSGVNGIATYNVALDYTGDEKQAELDRRGGDAVFFHILYKNNNRMAFNGQDLSVSEGKCLSRLNMYLKGDEGRKKYSGVNAAEVLKDWRFGGFQAEGKVEPRGVNVFSLSGTVRTRVFGPFAKDAATIVLLVKKVRISETEPGYANTTAKRRIMIPVPEMPPSDTDDGISEIDMDTSPIDTETTFTEMETTRNISERERLMRSSRALVSHTSKQITTFKEANGEDDEEDPFVWQLIPWIGRRHELPPPQLYTTNAFVGDYIYIGMHWHYEQGSPAFGIMGKHAEYYSPNDTTDRFRQVGKTLPDVRIQVNRW